MRLGQRRTGLSIISWALVEKLGTGLREDERAVLDRRLFADNEDIVLDVLVGGRRLKGVWRTAGRHYRCRRRQRVAERYGPGLELPALEIG